MNVYALSLTLVLGGDGRPVPRPGRFTPLKRPGTQCIADWVAPRAGLDG